MRASGLEFSFDLWLDAQCESLDGAFDTGAGTANVLGIV